MINKILTILKNRYAGAGGYRELFIIAFPLILSTASWSLQQFVDRVFLTWYSADAMAAAMPAGILNFAMLCLFQGTAGYVNTFVAQYYGSGQKGKIGRIVWQGIYVSVIGGLIVLLYIPFAPYIFNLIGHDSSIRQLEIVYFQILCFGGFQIIVNGALSGFLSGRSKTWVLFAIYMEITIVNIILDYFLIFGNFGFPRMGIKGAAIASVISVTLGTLTFFWVFLSKKNEIQFKARSSWRFSKRIFSKLIKYGLPGGIQFFIDIAGFSFFLLMIGRLGTIELVATNIAFNVNLIAFMPMLGMGIAVSVLVGQYLGSNKPEVANRSAWSAFHLAAIYMSIISLFYFLTPELFLIPYEKGADPETFPKIKEMVIFLLKFVAFYCLFDGAVVVFSSVLKGAGDTRFVLKMVAFLTFFSFILPIYLGVNYWDWGLTESWFLVIFYLLVMSSAFIIRFMGGKWKSMSVIEDSYNNSMSEIAKTNFPID